MGVTMATVLMPADAVMVSRIVEMEVMRLPAVGYQHSREMSY